jgi:hypothetical protein
MVKTLSIIAVIFTLVGCGSGNAIDKGDLPSHCVFASETINGSQINYCSFPNGDRCYVLEGKDATGNSLDCSFVTVP